jgi:hypothetical protein
MSDYRKKITSAVAAGALLLNLVTPAFAGVTIEISGNGDNTENEVEFEHENEVKVTQTNVANVLNDVKAEAKSGDNEANYNVGGDVEINAGKDTTDVPVNNTLNTNVAKVDACCEGDVEAKIHGNGPDTDNEIELELENEVEIKQANQADVWNYIEAEAESGDNEAEGNVGGGVKITSGHAKSTVAVSNTANSNSAWVAGKGNGGKLSAIISENGPDSDNEIELELENEVELLQGNLANILNDVEAEADSGDNKAEENVGGDVVIEAGDATVDVTVDNLVNFNWADVDGCGCIEDILAKIHGNGPDAENEIEVELETETEVEQANDFDCKFTEKDACASVKAEAESGDNKAKDNVEGDDKDPSIESGDASSTVEVNNSGNSNVFGDLPEDHDDDAWEGFHFNFNFSFDLEDLLDALLG